MESNTNFIDNRILVKLKDIMPDCSLRYVPVENKSYICGYDSDHDVSIRLTYFNSDPYYLYEIEYRGSTILRRKALIEYLTSYIYIIENIINFSRDLKKQCSSFPHLPTKDIRNLKLEQIL